MSLPAVLYDHVPTEESVRWAKEKRQRELLEQQLKEKEEKPSESSTSQRGQETTATTTTTTTTENSADDGGDANNKGNKGFGYYVSSMICQVSAPLWSPPENDDDSGDADKDNNEDDPSHDNSEDHDENDSGEENDTPLVNINTQPQHEHESAFMDDEMDNAPPRGNHLSFSWLHQHPDGRMETILEADVGADYVFVPPPSIVHGAINDDRRLSAGVVHVPSTHRATTSGVLTSWLRAMGPTATKVASTYANALWRACWNAYGRNNQIFFHLESRRSTIIQSYDDMSQTVLLDDSGNRLILPGRIIDLNGRPVPASTSNLMEANDENNHHDDVAEGGGTLIVPASSSSSSLVPTASIVATAPTSKSRSWFGSNTVMVSAADLLIIQQQNEQQRQEDSRRRRMGKHGNEGEDNEEEDNDLVILAAATGSTRLTTFSSTTTLSPAHQWTKVLWHLCHRQTRGWYRQSLRILRSRRRWGREWLQARLRYLVWLTTTITTQSHRPIHLLPAAVATTTQGGNNNHPSALAAESAVKDVEDKGDRTWVEIELAMWKDLCKEDEERHGKISARRTRKDLQIQ